MKITYYEKTILVTTVLCLVGILAVNAQSNTKKFNFGVRGGLNFATVSSSDFDNPGWMTSFYGGLVAEAPITDRFSVQAEAFYSGQGFSLGRNINGEDIDFQVAYFQVPLLAKFYLIKGLNVHAGPQFGFKVNQEINFATTDDGRDLDSDSVKGFDFGMTAGVEYKFDSGFFVQVRYSHGFSEVIENTDVKNSLGSIGVGYMF